MASIYKFSFLLILIAAESNPYETYNGPMLTNVRKETRRLANISKSAMYVRVDKSKTAISKMVDAHTELYQNNYAEEAATKWKTEFEKTWADDFDRALIISTVCNEMFHTPDQCDVGITWYSDYDVREYEIIRNEWISQVEEAIRQTLEKVKQEKEARSQEL